MCFFFCFFWVKSFILSIFKETKTKLKKKEKNVEGKVFVFCRDIKLSTSLNEKLNGIMVEEEFLNLTLIETTLE